MSEQDIAGILDLSKKKKKKKKKTKTEEPVATTSDPQEAGAGAGGDADDTVSASVDDEVSAIFAGKKKKKRKDKDKDKKDKDAAADEANSEGEADDDADAEGDPEADAEADYEAEAQAEDVGMSVRFADEAEEGEEAKAEGEAEQSRPWDGSKRDYTFKELLDRFYYLMHGNDANVGKGRLTLRPPEVYREGTKKTVFVNFGEICRALKREKDHMLAFMLTELGTTGSIDASDRLTMRGRLLPRQIQTLLRRYITEYVTCHMCKSPDTALEKNSAMRLHFVTCNVCQSSRSVTQIKAGYKAQVGRRKKK